jgi:EmrB/QacA subfamily drug resistance transporter
LHDHHGFGIIPVIVSKVTSPLNALTAGERKRWIALLVVCLAMLMNVLDASVVNVALPKIQRSLHISQANLTWIINAYLITFGGFLLLAGRIGDLVGRKRVFLLGIAIFTVASMVCGVAGSELVLIVARAVQGFGGAVSSSVIIAIIVTEFPEPGERAKAMSAYIFVAVGGGAIGLLVGGIITQAVSWHWIFFINLPVGVIALLLGVVLIDESEGSGVGDGVDVLGSLLVTASMMTLIYAIVKASSDGWGSAATLGFGALAAALLVAFVVLESRLANPIIPLRIFRVRTLTISSLVRGFVVTGMYATFFLGALYFEHVRHLGALDTGLAFLPMSVVVAIFSSGLTARLVGRFGAKQVLIPGLSAMLLGLLILTRQGPHSAYFPGAFLAFTVMGIGGGTAFTPLLTIAMSEVPAAEAGLGSGIINVSMQGSAALGVAILGTIAASHTKALSATHSHLVALTDGYQLAFTIAAGCVLVGMLLALFVLPAPAVVPKPLPGDAAAPERELSFEHA